ncbi:hypothetical protein BT93_A0414 [Corymbia citriodora subsp. variegata]|nr:hypothetical protein BT93_A0414 [Corymbia citriodora subsp. variegata]
MDTPSRVAVMLVGSLLMFPAVQGAPNTSITYRGCMAVPIRAATLMLTVWLMSLLKWRLTPNHANYDYYTTSPYPTTTAYGYATCNPALSYSDCGICVSAAKARILADCPNSLGVDMVFEDCSMRYESYSFTG